MRKGDHLRAAFFLPVVSLTVAMAAAWQSLLPPTIGPLNALLRRIGMVAPSFWLSSSDTVLTTAGLSAIPRELHAAAGVDGARSTIDRLRLVT